MHAAQAEVAALRERCSAEADGRRQDAGRRQEAEARERTAREELAGVLSSTRSAMDTVRVEAEDQAVAAEHARAEAAAMRSSRGAEVDVLRDQVALPPLFTLPTR